MSTAFHSTASTSAVNSFFSYDDFDVSQALHPTPSDHSFCCPLTTDPFQAEPDSEPDSDSGSEPDFNSPCGSIWFAAADSGLASCTEGLGFESSNTMVSDDNTCCDCCSVDRMITEDDYYKRRDNREMRSPEPEKKDFPPPLSSLSENGRRNFMLKQMRNNGRLEIVRVSINRAEIHASRQNGRLRMHLVVDDECEYDDPEEETREEVENEEEEEAEERENEVGETAEVAVADAVAEDKDWKIPAVRRCYEREVLHAWGQQQHRCVTSM